MKALKEYFAATYSNAKQQPILYIGMLFSVVFGIVNMIISLVNLSLYLGLIGIYSVILGITKLTSYERHKTIQTFENRQAVKDVEKLVAKRIAICTAVMSFIVFSFAIVCTFFQEDDPSVYSLIFIYYFGAFAIVNIIISTISALKTRKNRGLIMRHIKLIDLAHALITLALTQRTIVYYVGHEYAKIISGIGGIVFSLCAMGVCLLMLKKARVYVRG